MKRLLLISLLATGCFPQAMMSGDAGMMRSMGEKRAEAPWPTVRIDEPAGATVIMEPGVFGDGIHATAPLEGQFQPTAPMPRAGFPLELQLDAATAHRYGVNQPVRIYARLNVNRSMKRHGILVLAPSECALRALVAGDLEELVVRADVLPTADEACRMHEHGAGSAPSACPMMHGGSSACPMMHGGSSACPMMHGGPSACPMMHGGASACPPAMSHHGSCGSDGDHGGGCGPHQGRRHRASMFCGSPPPGAMLTLRMTKF